MAKDLQDAKVVGRKKMRVKLQKDKIAYTK